MLVLQGHPDQWDHKRWEGFTQIIDFPQIEERGVYDAVRVCREGEVALIAIRSHDDKSAKITHIYSP